QRDHFLPMLSIDDVFSEDELAEFFRRIQRLAGEERISVMVEPKIDGVAVALHYREGELEFAVTRGDGLVGDDITENVRTIQGVPLRLNGEVPTWLEVRGEVFMPNSRFAAMNEQRQEAGLTTFKNPRNATAGTLKLLDSREVSKRPLDFLAHGMGRIDGVEFVDMDEFRGLLDRVGIPRNGPIWKADDLNGVIAAIRELDVERHEFDYETDGAVVKVTSLEQQSLLGATARAPRWSAAYKYPPEQKETVIREITVQVGRTGVLTPVAELDPVLVSGTTVSRATLHNQDEIDRKDVRVGDAVLIEKAGEIIPAVVKVILEKRRPDAKRYNLFEAVGGRCPSCDSEIVQEDGFVAWKCANPVCPAKAANRLKLFVSRKALDIDGVGSIVAEKLVERGVVADPLDLFEITESQLAEFNLGTESEPRVLGAKNAAKIVATLKRAREAPLYRWIYGIGIPQVGESAAKELERLHETVSELNGSPILEALSQLKTGDRKEDDLVLAPYQIAGEVGPTVARNVISFFSGEEGSRWLEQLEKLNISPRSSRYAPVPGNEVSDGCASLSGKKIVITGTLSSPRDEIKALIESQGGKVTGSVSKNTDYLLSGEGGGSKRDKAESLGIEVISEADLNRLLDS
ncbi:MAG: NAD-dependent DNA ligase LigA, partial [Verrucomicrobiota bacterium]